MIPPAEMMLIQVEVTNACPHRCSNCSRLIGHHKKPFFMSLDEIENAFDSLEGYPGHWGIMGGEPTLHRDFAKICKLIQKYQPVKARRELWTAGYKWNEYEKIIHETFYPELIAFNDHSKPDYCWHQPLLIAIDEVVKDKKKLWKLIDNCWIQNRWSASITPKGAFFCEVAAAQAYLFGGEGLPVTKGWWRRPLEHFEYQIKRYCPNCSAALPMPCRINSLEKFDNISPEMLEWLKDADSPKVKRGDYKVCDCKELAEFVDKLQLIPQKNYRLRGGWKDCPKWTPWNYRPDKAHEPENG